MSESYDTQTAVEAFREMHSSGEVNIDRAVALAEPWGVNDAVREWSEERKGNDDFPEMWKSMPVTLLLRFIVSRGIGDKPISASEYFFGNSARGIGGHKKADRGEYKGNLAIIERDAGMEMTYGLFSSAQNGTEPCEECGRTCIYAQEDGDHLECANCDTTRKQVAQS